MCNCGSGAAGIAGLDQGAVSGPQVAASRPSGPFGDSRAFAYVSRTPNRSTTIVGLMAIASHSASSARLPSRLPRFLDAPPGLGRPLPNGPRDGSRACRRRPLRGVNAAVDLVVATLEDSERDKDSQALVDMLALREGLVAYDTT